MQTIGSRAQVMHGNAKMTGGGLKKKDLKYNKQGKIVSKKMSTMAKKEKRLQKAGYKTQKGVFQLFQKQRGGYKYGDRIKYKLFGQSNNNAWQYGRYNHELGVAHKKKHNKGFQEYQVTSNDKTTHIVTNITYPPYNMYEINLSDFGVKESNKSCKQQLIDLCQQQVDDLCRSIYDVLYPTLAGSNNSKTDKLVQICRNALIYDPGKENDGILLLIRYLVLFKLFTGELCKDNKCPPTKINFSRGGYLNKVSIDKIQIGNETIYDVINDMDKEAFTLYRNYCTPEFTHPDHHILARGVTRPDTTSYAFLKTIIIKSGRFKDNKIQLSDIIKSMSFNYDNKCYTQFRETITDILCTYNIIGPKVYHFFILLETISINYYYCNPIKPLLECFKKLCKNHEWFNQKVISTGRKNINDYRDTFYGIIDSYFEYYDILCEGVTRKLLLMCSKDDTDAYTYAGHIFVSYPSKEKPNTILSLFLYGISRSVFNLYGQCPPHAKYSGFVDDIIKKIYEICEVNGIKTIWTFPREGFRFKLLDKNEKGKNKKDKNKKYYFSKITDNNRNILLLSMKSILKFADIVYERMSYRYPFVIKIIKPTGELKLNIRHNNKSNISSAFHDALRDALHDALNFQISNIKISNKLMEDFKQNCWVLNLENKRKIIYIIFLFNIIRRDSIHKNIQLVDGITSQTSDEFIKYNIYTLIQDKVINNIIDNLERKILLLIYKPNERNNTKEIFRYKKEIFRYKNQIFEPENI
jgi:hypothetical protein